MNISELLSLVIKKNASDLHLLVGSPPVTRINGRMENIGSDILTKEQLTEMIYAVVTPEQKELLSINKEVDFSYSYEESRFRINAYYQQGTLAAAFRHLPQHILTLDELHLPDICRQLTELKQGFILVTGPTGHGKSTTLAAMINSINLSRAEHIITIEDPVEYVYPKGQSLISQREMHLDTHSFQIALRSVLREDPNVVLIGEMRDYETISAAMTIAETGHLVFATLHTNSAAQTLDRIVDVFPEEQQQQIRIQLANTVEAILSQRLIPSIDGGRLPVMEILLGSPAVKNIIREGKSHLIDNLIQTSGDLGMMSLEFGLAKLVKDGKISMETALSYALRPEEVTRFVRK